MIREVSTLRLIAGRPSTVLLVLQVHNDNFMEDSAIYKMSGLARMARRHLSPKSVGMWGAKQKEGILTV